MLSQNTVWSVNDGAAGDPPETNMEPVVAGFRQKTQISFIYRPMYINKE